MMMRNLSHLPKPRFSTGLEQMREGRGVQGRERVQGGAPLSDWKLKPLPTDTTDVQTRNQRPCVQNGVLEHVRQRGQNFFGGGGGAFLNTRVNLSNPKKPKSRG